MNVSSFKRRFFGLAGTALLGGLLIACGGGDDDGDSGSNNPPAEATSGSGSSSNTPAAGSTAPSGSNNSGGNAAVADLNSYKYTMKFTGNGGPVADILESIPGASTVEFSGAYIKPDKATTSIKAGSFESISTIIGNQQWTSFGGLVQGPTPATATDVTDANFLAAFFEDDGFNNSLKDFDCGGSENVNGVSARKCTLDKAGFEKLVQSNPDFAGGIEYSSLSKAESQVWLTEKDYPVRMRMDVAGKDTANKDFAFKIEVDVTDINGNFTISPPKS